MKVLVVDDSAVMRRLYSRAADSLGWQACAASEGSEALALLEESSWDLLVTDWHMPVMDGLELIRRVRADERRKGMSIVLVTSDCALSSLALALEAGADEVFMKPITVPSLAVRLEEFMASHERAGP